MPSLTVPDSGLLLEIGTTTTSTPSQAFPITLSDNVIEDMIRCVQNGGDLEISLGGSPTFLYGSNSHILSPIPESFSCDFFLTKPFESTKRASQIPNTMSLWKRPKNFPPMPEPNIRVDTMDTQTGRVVKSRPVVSSASSGLDSDIENLQNSLAAAEASKKHSKVLDTLPSNKKGNGKPVKSKLLSSMASYGGGRDVRSLPTSPALTAVGSPALNPVLSASQQVMEKAKEARVTIVHELAVQERSWDYLEEQWDGKEEDFKAAVEKVADFNSDSQKWAMKKNYWRELDVWKYDYATQEDRQKAIENAIRQFDRMRLATTEPEWQKLLPREERGKGKILSKLQANIAKGSAAAAPKIKVQKVDDVNSDAGAKDDDVPKKGGETMARSTSQPLPAKSKRPSEREAQPKKASSNTKKPATPKTSPAKSKDKAPATKGGRILSAEFITNSDSDSSEEQPLAVKVAAAKARPPQQLPAASPKPKIATAKPKPKPATKEPVKEPAKIPSREAIKEPAREPVKDHVKPPMKAVKTQPPKRRREADDDEDDSSSSGTPLSKRIKPKQPLKAPVNLKHRPSDASQNSRGTSSGISYKSKNTSPAKSSPLASSPPTNASDLDPSEPKKRKLDSSDSRDAKRQRVLNQELITKAMRFKLFYEKYEALHYEITLMDNPPEDKMTDLLEMRARLKNMKNEIYKECPPAIAVA